LPVSGCARGGYPAFTWPVSGVVGLHNSHNPEGSIEYRAISLLAVIP